MTYYLNILLPLQPRRPFHENYVMPLWRRLPAVSVAFLRMQLHHSAGAETAQVVQRVELHTTKTF